MLAEPSAREILESSLKSIHPPEYLKNSQIGYISTLCAIADGPGLNSKILSLLSKPLPSSKFPQYLRSGSEGNEVDLSVLPYLRSFPLNCNEIIDDSSFKRLQREVSGRVSSKHQLANFYYYGVGALAAACVVDRYKGTNNMVPFVYKLLTQSADKHLSSENSKAAAYGYKFYVDGKELCRSFSNF